MDYQLLAAQLRKPEGEFGKEVSEQMNYYNREINLKTIDFLSIEENDKVLEIGMGNGLFCKHILEKNNSVSYTGCDYSDLMVREAMDRNQEYVKKGRADFYNIDASNLPFPDNYFTKMLTVNTLYFWDDPLVKLREIKRVLVSEGLAIFSVRTRTSMAEMPVVQYGFQLFDVRDIRDLLDRAEFKKIETYLEQDKEIEMPESTERLYSLYGICKK